MSRAEFVFPVLVLTSVCPSSSPLRTRRRWSAKFAAWRRPAGGGSSRPKDGRPVTYLVEPDDGVEPEDGIEFEEPEREVPRPVGLIPTLAFSWRACFWCS